MTSKQWLRLTLILVLILAILLPISVLYFKSLFEHQKAKDDVQISLLTDGMRQAYKEIDHHLDTIAQLRDSIFSLNVQKGQVEIELNRKESQLNGMVGRHYGYIEFHDTTKILMNCDSVINEVQPYILQNFEYRRLIDTLYNKISSVANQYDSIFLKQSNLNDSILLKNSDLAQKNDKLKDQKFKAQKFGLIASIVCVVETAIFLLIK